MKKITLILLILLLFTFIGTICKAELANNQFIATMQIDNPVITINGEEIEIDSNKNISPTILSNRTFIPIRSFIENIGGEVNWNNETKKMILTFNNNEISFTVNSNTAYINNSPLNIDTPPIIIDSRIFLPLRFISEGFGFKVNWESDNQIITITNIDTNNKTTDETTEENYITLDDTEIQLENGLSAVSYEGNYMFDEFIAQGGAASDSELADFMQNTLLKNITNINFNTEGFGCSTLSVKSPENELLFGRNFDWSYCDGLIVKSTPLNGYSSISTVNLDFIKIAYKAFNQLPQNLKTIIALYAPLDGMNEKGLCVAVNMIQDNDSINQDTEKPDITTTTVIRLILDKAANVDEAVNLLKQYDMHSSMGLMVHFALTDAGGKSVVVEYVNNEMIVTETPIVTNFYISEGSKNGIGTSQSHKRYEILSNTLSEKPEMSITDVKNALDSVSKNNFGEYESTEWSIVYNQNNGEVQYYHRENYDNVYKFKLW